VRRLHRRDRAADREHRDHDRFDPELALAAGRRPRAGRGAYHREQDRRHDRANPDRRDRDHPRERAEDDAGDAELLWRYGARRRHRDAANAHETPPSLAPA
jgi:hypothetical protein